MRTLLLFLMAAGAAAAQTICLAVTPPASVAVISCPSSPTPVPDTSTAPVFLTTNGGTATFGPGGFIVTYSAGNAQVFLDTTLLLQKFITTGPPTAGIQGARRLDRAYDAVNKVEYECLQLTCDTGGFQTIASGTGSGPAGPAGPAGPPGPQGPAGPAGSGSVVASVQVAPPKSNTDACTAGTWAISADKRFYYVCVGGAPGTQQWLAFSSFGF